MSVRQLDEWLADIVAWGERLAGHVAGMTFQEFAADMKTQDAASKCIESIGLAAKEVSQRDPLLDETYPDLKLSQAYGQETNSATATMPSSSTSFGGGNGRNTQNSRRCTRRDEGRPEVASLHLSGER